jgi:hypothetical protein
MLETARSRARDVREDDAGVSLVAVIVVMLVGFIIASTIAASVLFTIQANASNRTVTQAFISAESGRDAAVAAVAAHIDDGALDCPLNGIAVPGSTVPGLTYTASVHWATSTDTPANWSSVESGATDYAVCPTATSNWVVIHSEGTDGAKTSTVDAAYPWTVAPDTRPAGTMAYFDGEFKATKSTYSGDLVIRGTSDYECNNGSGNEIKGDLWVTNAGVRVTGDCYVTGSIYAHGLVSVQNKNFVVGGDIVTEIGDVNLAADNVKVGGEIYSGRNVVLSKSGTVGTSIKAAGTITSPIPSGWKRADGTAITPTPNQPAPVIDPPLDAVHDATAWLELDRTLDWGTTPITGTCSSAGIVTLLQTVGDRVMIDLTGCPSTTFKPGNFTLRRDAVLYFPAGSTMDLDLSSFISKPATGSPQFIVLHGDANLADGVPTCTSGADKLAIGTGIAVRTMIYSPCGINNTIALTMTGQLYMGNDGLHLNGGTFTCAPMGWSPAFKNLSCGVKGDGGIFDPTRTTVSLGSRAYQTER